jgi:hypothetical protein
MMFADDFELARRILLRPRMYSSEATTLRDVLALMHGVAVGRYPPHGNGFLPGFSAFVMNRLRATERDYHKELLIAFGEWPLDKACSAVLALLEEWKALPTSPANTWQSPPDSA